MMTKGFVEQNKVIPNIINEAVKYIQKSVQLAE